VLRRAQHERLLVAVLTPLLLGAYDPGSVTRVRVDPLTIPQEDFARHRSPATWRGLHVERVDFAEERARWRLYRITDPRRPRGPLWFVPHDDENAGFEAALVGLRRYGGTIVAVDGGGRRRNRTVAFGPAIDPNRNFTTACPATRVRCSLPSIAARGRSSRSTPTRPAMTDHARAARSWGMRMARE